MVGEQVITRLSEDRDWPQPLGNIWETSKTKDRRTDRWREGLLTLASRLRGGGGEGGLWIKMMCGGGGVRLQTLEGEKHLPAATQLTFTHVHLPPPPSPGDMEDY